MASIKSFGICRCLKMTGGPILLLIGSFLITRLAMPWAITFFYRHKLVCANYRGDYIPLGTGVLLSIVVTGILGARVARSPSIESLLSISTVFFMSTVGAVDDFWGNGKTKGLKGHLHRLIQGQVTTGIIKAGAGVALSLANAVYISGNALDFAVNFLVILLFTNTINLLDLRPGRAIKASLLVYGILLFYNYSQAGSLLLPIIGALLAYFPYDLHERAMLGDAGSNMLGIAAGLVCSLILPFGAKVVLTVTLIGLHWYTEKHSLTNLIESIAILNYVDRIGRK